MAGHSKWANIQYRKGKQDAKRGKLFSKLIREITIAAKMGGGDPDANPRLRTAIDGAKSQSLPKDTIEKAVKRGSGDTEGENVDEIRYEGYGPSGVAMIVDTMTDNKNRTVAEVRHAFSKYNGNLGTDGSVAYLFSKVGLISYPTGSDEDAIMDAALEGGAEDVVANNDGSIDVLTEPNGFVDVKNTLITAGLEPENAEVTMHALTSVTLDLKSAQTMLNLLDMLEDLDDVQKVYSNANIPDNVLAQLE